MGKFKIQKSTTVNVGYDYNSSIGGTGGNTGITGTQLVVYANVNTTPAYHSVRTAFVIAGRGKGRFLVNDGTDSGVCTLTNLLSAELVSGQMSVQANTNFIAKANLRATTGSATTVAYLTYSTANVAGVTAITTGTRFTGTGLNGNVVVGNVTVNGLLANATVNFSSQIVSNVSGQDMSTSVYAARIDNKFIRDFDGNKYLWSFNTPTSSTVQLLGA
jgi:hypothetical protein